MSACPGDIGMRVELQRCDHAPEPCVRAMQLADLKGVLTIESRVYDFPWGRNVPAYLLRAPQQKRASWEDLQLAQRVVAGEETA